MARLLPDDVLADVLRRCVCRAWRALIDGRGLLRVDLLPRSLAGLFVNYNQNIRRAMRVLPFKLSNISKSKVIKCTIKHK